MKLRWAQRVGAGGLLGLCTAVMAPACVDNESTLVVEFVTTNYAECVDGDFMSLGTMDIALTQSYYNQIEIANQLVIKADEVRNRTESDIIVLREAEVSVESTNGTLSEFVWPLAGIVDAGGPGEARGKTDIGVLMIDPVAASQLSSGDIALTSIKVFGRTEGGFEVESPVFTFPIQVCEGCLVRCDLGDDPEQTDFICDMEAVGEGFDRIGEDCPSPCNESAVGFAYCNGLLSP